MHKTNPECHHNDAGDLLLDRFAHDIAQYRNNVCPKMQSLGIITTKTRELPRLIKKDKSLTSVHIEEILILLF